MSWASCTQAAPWTHWLVSGQIPQWLMTHSTAILDTNGICALMYLDRVCQSWIHAWGIERRTSCGAGSSLRLVDGNHLAYKVTWSVARRMTEAGKCTDASIHIEPILAVIFWMNCMDLETSNLICFLHLSCWRTLSWSVRYCKHGYSWLYFKGILTSYNPDFPKLLLSSHITFSSHNQERWRLPSIYQLLSLYYYLLLMPWLPLSVSLLRQSNDRISVSVAPAMGPIISCTLLGKSPDWVVARISATSSLLCSLRLRQSNVLPTTHKSISIAHGGWPRKSRTTSASIASPKPSQPVMWNGDVVQRFAWYGKRHDV